MGKQDVEYDYSFEVELKGVGIGKEKARVGVGFGDTAMDLATAEELFVAKQLRVHLSADPNAGKDGPGQQKMDVGLLSLAAVAEARRVTLSAAGYGTSLAFQKSAVELGLLGRFANTKGQLRCTCLGPLEHDTEMEEEEEGEE